MKGSCHNSKTSNHIDIKLEPVTKLENKTGNAKKIWQKCHVRKLWRHCHFSFSWPILSNLVTFYLTKSESRTKKYLTQLLYYCFELEYSHTTALSKGTIFDVFLQKCWHQQNYGGLGIKMYIFWNYICVCTYVPNFKFLA